MQMWNRCVGCAVPTAVGGGPTTITAATLITRAIVGIGAITTVAAGGDVAMRAGGEPLSARRVRRTTLQGRCAVRHHILPTLFPRQISRPAPSPRGIAPARDRCARLLRAAHRPPQTGD